MTDQIYDLIVIGAGPGGYIAAIKAAELGFTVAVVEKRETLGGVCLNEGCIPSKALLESSEHVSNCNHGLAEHGIDIAEIELNLEQMMSRKTGIINKLTSGIAGLFKKNKIVVITGQAKLTGKSGDPHTVIVSNGNNDLALSAKTILLATGSTPTALPAFPFDGKHIINSSDALKLAAVPKNLLIIGAGVIGLELGSVWSRLGAKVTVVEMLSQVLPQADPQIAQLLQRSLKKQGLNILTKTTLDNIEITKNGVIATITTPKGEQQLKADKVLVATGRRVQTSSLGLDLVGLQLNQQGQIDVDENYQTSATGIYAIGDLIHGPMLAHKASDEGRIFAERLAGKNSKLDYKLIPAVTYTHPEVASIGETEASLKDKGITYKTGKAFFAASGRAHCAGTSDGFVKIIAAMDSGIIYGIHIIGPQASELIAVAGAILSLGGTAHDLASICHAHPTLAETLKEAALAVSLN